MAREKVFKFKQFNVINDKTAMKVGTDGVLIGAWCDVAGAQHVLDVGTGCGLIALMIAQRNKNAQILGIDIDQGAVDEAMINFHNSPWSNRLNAEHVDFNDFLTSRKYDLIVSNPPFFSNGVLPPNHGRNKARHTGCLTYDQLIGGAKSLLRDNGILSFISPADNEMAIRRGVVAHDMSIKRLTKVIPVAGGDVKRLMWELVMYQTACVEDIIIIRNTDTDYSDEYKNLTQNFYLR